MSYNELKNYNGYTNYFTWLISLHLYNDESTQSYIRELSEDSYILAEVEKELNYSDWESLDVRDIAINELSERIKNLIQGVMHDDSSPNALISDMFNGAVSFVNFYEIAEDYIDTYIQEELV